MKDESHGKIEIPGNIFRNFTGCSEHACLVSSTHLAVLINGIAHRVGPELASHSGVVSAVVEIVIEGGPGAALLRLLGWDSDNSQTRPLAQAWAVPADVTGIFVAEAGSESVGAEESWKGFAGGDAGIRGDLGGEVGDGGVIVGETAGLGA